jgi:DNA-binding SARP family transcriptional activator
VDASFRSVAAVAGHQKPRVRLCLCVVGAIRLFDAQTGIDCTPRGRKARAALAYIAMQSHGPATRRRLANLLWGDRLEQQSRGSLRQALSELRASHVTIDETSGGISFDRGNLTVDIVSAVQALADDNPVPLERIVAQPDFSLLDDLDGITQEFDDWLRTERVRLGTWILSDVGDQAQRLFEEGKLALARTVLQALSRIDPAQERTVSLAMRVDFASGDLTTLHRRFRAHCAILKDELGIDPSPSVTEVYQQLIGSDFASPQIGQSISSAKDTLTPIASVDHTPHPSPKWRIGIALGVVACLTIFASVQISDFRLTPVASSIPALRSQDPGLLRANALIRQRTRPAYAEAETLLRQTVVRDPSNAEAWARLGVVVWMPWWWKAQDRPSAKEELRSEAIGYARRALALNSNSAAGHAALGMILTDTADGLASLTRAVALDANNAESWLWLGNARNSRHDLSGALAAYEHAATIEPSWYRTVDPYCEALQRLGRGREAFALLDHYERTADDPGHAYLERANLLMAEGRLSEAAGEAFRNLAARPANPWFARQLLLRLAHRMNDQRLVERLIASDINLKRALSDAIDDGSNFEQAQRDPDGWWNGANLGAKARQLLVRGRVDMLLALYDRRFGTARDFHDHFLGFDNLALPIALAMRKAGRDAEAAELEQLFRRNIVQLEKQGATGYELALGKAWLASLRGESAEAADEMALAIKRGWRGQNPDFGMPPDSDPLFGPVAADAKFQRSLLAFSTALTAEAQRFRNKKFTNLPI